MKALPIKSYQFFKIYKRFDKEKEKMLIQQSMRKEKRRKFGFCLIFFLFRELIRRAIFAFYYQDDAINMKRRNWERQIARNGKLQYLFQK